MKPLMNLDEVAFDAVEDAGTTTMRCLALPARVEIEACEYPDSQRVLVVAGPRGERRLRKRVRAENTVDCYDRESTDAPPHAQPGVAS